MPRARLGSNKKCDPVTALFTHEERLRIEQMARTANVPISVFVHGIVVQRLGLLQQATP
jgi:hypothetical protein